MDQERIDRLFREQLNSYEAAPSHKAWESVEAQIGKKKSSPYLYWVAASVTILAVLTWILYPNTAVQNELTPIASAVDHPVPFKADTYVWSLPEFTRVTSPGQTSKSSQVETKSIKTRLASNEAALDSREAAPEEVLELETIEPKPVTEVALLEEELLQEEEAYTQDIEKSQERFKPMKIDLSKVKITYIAAEEKEQPTDSVGGIKKLFAKAGKISPGNVLADIRTAKDNLINNGFKSADKDRASL